MASLGAHIAKQNEKKKKKKKKKKPKQTSKVKKKKTEQSGVCIPELILSDVLSDKIK